MVKEKKKISENEIKELKKGLPDLFGINSVKNEKSEIYQFLENFLSDENLEQKTEIKKPTLFVALDVLIELYDSMGLKEPSDILKGIKNSLYRHNISKNRLGRKEIIESIKALGVNINSSNISPIKQMEEIF